MTEYVSKRLDAHQIRLNLHSEAIGVLKDGLAICESKVDDVKSDNEIAIGELDHRLSELIKIVNETINASTRLAKQVAELQGEVHATSQ